LFWRLSPLVRLFFTLFWPLRNKCFQVSAPNANLSMLRKCIRLCETIEVCEKEERAPALTGFTLRRDETLKMAGACLIYRARTRQNFV
jgi:hypothetical protein